jgi:hypothetical protein
MEIDRLIREKRSQIGEALAAHQKAHEAVAWARNRLSELLVTAGAEPAALTDSEEVELAKARLQELESAEEKAAIHFSVISAELTRLHQEKYGVTHVTWIGPRPRPM